MVTPKFKVGDRVEYIAFPGDRGRVKEVVTDPHNAYYVVEWPDDPEAADLLNGAYEWELMPSHDHTRTIP
jgi:hypothetical protein